MATPIGNLISLNAPKQLSLKFVKPSPIAGESAAYAAMEVDDLRLAQSNAEVRQGALAPHARRV